jgi:hypothetical protein
MRMRLRALGGVPRSQELSGTPLSSVGVISSGGYITEALQCFNYYLSLVIGH